MAINNVRNEHQRLSLLLALSSMGTYQTNDSMLRGACAAYGHNMSFDLIRSHLSWLNEQDLVSLEIYDSYTLAKLTGRGQDVAEGVCTCPGVKKPRAK